MSVSFFRLGAGCASGLFLFWVAAISSSSCENELEQKASFLSHDLRVCVTVTFPFRF